MRGPRGLVTVPLLCCFVSNVDRSTRLQDVVSLLSLFASRKRNQASRETIDGCVCNVSVGTCGTDTLCATPLGCDALEAPTEPRLFTGHAYARRVRQARTNGCLLKPLLNHAFFFLPLAPTRRHRCWHCCGCFPPSTNVYTTFPGV